VLAGGGAFTGLYRAWSGMTPPSPYEEHEHRADETGKSPAAVRRANIRAAIARLAAATGAARPAAVQSSTPPVTPILPHSANDLRNGIGAPLLC
jgi:hypothetical protein